jgi:hypothetical protein
MGKGIEVIAGRITNQAALTAVTLGTGDTLTVRASGSEASNVWLQSIWGSSASAGRIRVISPRMHDNVAGLTVRVPATVIRDLIGDYPEQRLYSQDTLVVQAAGGGAETDNAFLQIYYEDVPGIDAQLFAWEQIEPRIVNLASVEVAPVTSATVGDWSAGRAINADNDNFKADTSYALLGYETSVACGAIAVRGTDTGNLRIGGPGPTEPLATREYFVRKAIRTGRPHIPVINSQNKGSTLVFVCDPANAATINVALLFAELRP